MTKRARNVLAFYIVSICVEVMIAAIINSAITGNFQNIMYLDTVSKSISITAITIWNLFKGFWVGLYVFSEITWRRHAKKHKWLKKIYW